MKNIMTSFVELAMRKRRDGKKSRVSLACSALVGKTDEDAAKTGRAFGQFPMFTC